MLMKRILSMMSLALMLLAFGWAQQAQAKTVYLQPNDWTNDNARLALYAWGEGDGNDAWAEFTAVGTSGIYAASFDDATYSSGMIFVRMDPAQAMGWDAKWNQSGNLAVPAADNQLYSLSGWDGITEGNGVTVSSYFSADNFGYFCDFNTKIETSNHDFAVASNWGHIVGEGNYDGMGPYYMSYSYSSTSGIDGTGALTAYAQTAGDYGGKSDVVDVLVTPLVSGTIAMYAKASYSSPKYVEVYSVSEDGVTLGSLIQKFDLSTMDDSDIAGWKLITLNIDQEQRLGLRVSNAYIDNFMATSATIIPEKKLTINGVSQVSGSTPVACNQNADGSATVVANVKLKNTGDIDFVAGSTENYSLAFVWKPYYGGSETVYDDVTFDIPENIAVGEEKTIEVTFNVPAEVVSAIFSNQSSGYFYLKVKENVSKTVSSAQLQCQLKKYESKFIFDIAGTSYYSSSSATTTPINFGKISEETTLNYEIYNAGAAPVVINSFTLPAPFTSDAPATPFEVAGGEKKVIAITLPYGEPGIFAGDLVINYTNFGKEAQDYTLGISGTIVDPSKNMIAFNNADNTNGQFPEGSIHSDQVYISSATEGNTTNYFLQSTSTVTKFVTPLLTATAGESFTYDAWYSGYSANNSTAYVTVYTSTDRVNWTQLNKMTYSAGITSSAKSFTVTIPEAGDYYLAFEIGSVTRLDNIYGLTLAATPAHDWYLTEEADIPATGTQNADYTTTIKVKNISTDADNLTATLYVDGEAVATQEVSLTGNDKTAAVGTGRNGYSNIEDPTTIELTFKPHTPGTLPAYIELKADDTVVKTDEVQVTIAEEKAESELSAANGTSNSVLLWLNWNNSESVSLYNAEVLTNTFGLKPGDKISSITYKGYRTADAYTTTLSAWYEWTDDQTQALPAAGKYDPSSMTQIVSEEHNWVKDGSSSETVELITLTFEEPLVYEEGKSLRLLVRSEASTYKQAYFETTSISGTGASCYHRNDNATTFTTESWSNSGYLPNIHLSLLVETPKLFGTVDDFSKEPSHHLAGAKVTIRSSVDDVEYTGVTDENGNYCIDIVQKDLTYDEFFCELDGYATESYTERSGKNVTFNSDCDLWIEDYPFIGDETITGCSYNFGMYPCVELTISESTWATFYYERDSYMVPEGLTAYTAVKEGNEIVLSDRGLYIPAACPVVINGEPGTYQFKWTDTSYSYTGPNDLIGSEEGGTFGNDGAKYYVLSWKNKNKNIDEVGFYFLSGSKGKYAKVKAHQAYMRVEASQANEAGYSFVFDAGTTGISTVEADGVELDPNQPMYNLAGQRVGKDYRGVVLQNGKKIIKK